MRVLTDRTALIQAVDGLYNRGGFAVKLGETALLADQANLKRLVDAFPEYFTPNRTIRLICSTPQLSISKTQKMEKLK
jgi:hypothetical protein